MLQGMVVISCIARCAVPDSVVRTSLLVDLIFKMVKLKRRIQVTIEALETRNAYSFLPSSPGSYINSLAELCNVYSACIGLGNTFEIQRLMNKGLVSSFLLTEGLLLYMLSRTPLVELQQGCYGCACKDS
jgi:hypothetical protein